MIVGEVLNAIDAMKDDNLQVGLFVVSSPDKLYQDYAVKKSRLLLLLKNSFQIDITAPIITIIDGHSSSLSWIGSVKDKNNSFRSK